MKKRIASIIMLVVLVVGVVLAAYGISGRGIYDNAANMMGVNKKDAMSYIQDPSTLTEMSDVGKIGADKVKGFLKSLGLDAAAVDKAVDERAAYDAAVAKSKDRDAFLAYAQSVDETVTEDNFNDLVKDHERSDQMRLDMAKQALGVSDEEFEAVAGNEAVLELYRQGLPNLLNNKKMTSGVLVMFVGIILIVIAGAYFLIAAMSLKPRARVKAANPKVEKITAALLNYALFIILGLILIVVSIMRPDFLSIDNILNILQNASTKGILALGCAGLIVLAGTDLSIGRVLGLSAAVTASLVQSVTYVSRMYPTIVSPVKGALLLIPLCSSIAVAVLFSMINGFGVAKLHLHAFIVTLGTQLIAYGANCLYIESQPSGTAQALSTFDQGFLNVAAGAFNIGSIRVPIVVIYFLILAVHRVGHLEQDHPGQEHVRRGRQHRGRRGLRRQRGQDHHAGLPDGRRAVRHRLLPGGGPHHRRRREHRPELRDRRHQRGRGRRRLLLRRRRHHPGRRHRRGHHAGHRVRAEVPGRQPLHPVHHPRPDHHPGRLHRRAQVHREEVIWAC